MKNTDCPLEYLSGILAKDYKVKLTTTQYAKSKSKYSSINDDAWHGYIKKRLSATYVQDKIHVKLECSYTAEIPKAKSNGYSVYYHKRGSYDLDQISITMYGHHKSQANQKVGRYIPIYDTTIDTSHYISNAKGLTEPLTDFASAAELALAGQFIPKPIKFADEADKRFPIMACDCIDLVTIRENGRISSDIHDPNLKPYFLLYCNIPIGLPLIDIGKGHLAIVTDGQSYYTASRYLDKHVYLAQKDIPELSDVGGNIDSVATEAIALYLNSINEGIFDSRKLHARM